MSDLRSLLFPDPPRELPFRRGLKIVLRAAHVLCAGITTGAFVSAAAADVREAWLTAAIASGAAILLLDLHESAAFLVQVRGLVVALKLVLLALALAWAAAAPWLLGGLMVVSVLSSHAPSRVRYHVVFGRGRIVPSRSKG